MSESLYKGVLARERRAIAKAITLLESQHPADLEPARQLLHSLLPHTGNAFRVGITGPPGVGKSTLIEHLGIVAITKGHRVAVLTVDPSSESGGSILADKTRMQRLSRHPAAFIRPSASKGILGGVAARSREAMLVCEAAGYDIVLIETVGVGQTEVDAFGITDVFIVVQPPSAGDELHAMKMGVLGLADIVVVNKANLYPQLAKATCDELESMMKLRRRNGEHRTPEVLQLGAPGIGIDELWSTIQGFREVSQGSGAWQRRRNDQALQWMWRVIDARLRARFVNHPAVYQSLRAVEQRIGTGELTADAAALNLLRLFDQDL